jgi:hypothetical protein
LIPVLLVLTPMIAPLAWAQQRQNTPHVGYVYPAGGQQGTTVQVTVGGQFLDNVSRIMVSGRGVESRVVAYNKPVTGQALTALRDTVQALQQQVQRGAINPATQQRIADLRLRIADSQRRTSNPSLSELVTLEVTIAPGAEPGERRLRLSTPLGLTTPLLFVVGQLPEFREKDVKTTKADMETAITLPAVVNGRLIPGELDRARLPARGAAPFLAGDVDRYRFHAHEGDQLVAIVSARELMPYLADAVPGWIQPTLTLLDAEGHEVAYADDYRFHPDPVLHAEIPAEGDYVLEIKDAIYRGREDFVYRIAIGELPFVTSAFPLGGRAGAKTDVTLAGWNLPPKRLTVGGKNLEPGVIALPVRPGVSPLNRVPFAVDTLPEMTEKEPNNTMQHAQGGKTPVIVNGRIDVPGDIDVFSVSARAGDTIVAEVIARRLDSPLDAVLELTDANGHRVAWNDDHDDKSAGLETHHADPWLLAALPAAGTYYVRVGDVQRRGGPEYAYRLRISQPRADFELRISPSAINVGGGSTVPITMTAIRRDGFDGDIALGLKDAAGFTLSGALLPAGQEQIRLTLTAPGIGGPAGRGGGGGRGGRGSGGGRGNVAPVSANVSIEGRATINGKTVVREAVPADEMMQAFAYKHLVVADDLWVTVLGRGGTGAAARIMTPQPVKIRAGGTVQIRVSLPPAYQTFDKLQFQLSEQADGMTIGDVTVNASGARFTLQADSAKMKAGQRGNLIVEITGERTPPANAAAAAAARRRIVLGSLPAIAFEVIR